MVINGTYFMTPRLIAISRFHSLIRILSLSLIPERNGMLGGDGKIMFEIVRHLFFYFVAEEFQQEQQVSAVAAYCTRLCA